MDISYLVAITLFEPVYLNGKQMNSLEQIFDNLEEAVDYAKNSIGLGSISINFIESHGLIVE